MIKLLSSVAHNSSVMFSGNATWPSSATHNKPLVCRVPTTKISAGSIGEFRWANSELNDSSTSEASLSVTPNFILPVEKRPILAEVSGSTPNVPIIDIGRGGVGNLVEKIAKACEDYGLFMVINHGIPESLCESMLSAITDLFHQPPEVKALLVSNDPSREVRICNHYRKVEDKDNQNAKRLSMWSEVFKHPWHPTSASFAALLPLDSPYYRTVMTAYSKEVGTLISKLLSLMSQGLGLDGNYLERRLGENPLCRAQANYYPPCPNPDLTLGLGIHTDRDALTVVLPTSGVKGLQILKDEKWMDVDPVPNALVVNVGDQLQVLSNGKYKSVLHRVVTNKFQSRSSLAMFYGPDKNAIIGPIEDLIDEEHPPIYRNYYFGEFLEVYRKQEGKNRKIKDFFEIQG